MSTKSRLLTVRMMGWLILEKDGDTLRGPEKTGRWHRGKTNRNQSTRKRSCCWREGSARKAEDQRLSNSLVVSFTANVVQVGVVCGAGPCIAVVCVGLRSLTTTHSSALRCLLLHLKRCVYSLPGRTSL